MSSPDILDAVQWHEGMLLGPQHFQQAWLRSEQLLAYAMQATQPFYWGLRHFHIDQSALLGGYLRISELEAIMPDGLPVRVKAGLDDELQLDLEPYRDVLKRAPLDVYLCLPAYHPELPGSTRYHSLEGKPVTDYNTGENAVAMPRLKPRLSLAAGEEPPGRFSYFPLAQLAFRNENIVHTEFIPPLLEIGTGSPLAEWLNGLVVQIREKATLLSQQLRSPAHAVRGHKPMLYDTRTVLQGLLSLLPPVEALLRVGTVHPFQVYLYMCHLAGVLAAFTDATLPPVFPAYNHNNLRSSFEAVCGFIRDMLDRIHESYQIVAFHYQDGRFSLQAEPEWLENYLVIGLKGRSGMTESTLQEWGESSQIGAQDQIDSMLARRVLGPARRRIDREESMDLIAPREMVLLRVELEPDLIYAGEPLVILNEQKAIPAPQEVVLYVRR